MSEEPNSTPPVPAPTPPAPGSNIYSPHGNVDRSPVTFGANSSITATYADAALPVADTVDVKAEIAALKAILATLQIPDQQKADNAVQDAELEAEKENPDKEEVGGAVERVLKYAKAAQGFGEVVEKLKPSVKALAAWVGANHDKILHYVGLVMPAQ